MHRLTGAIPAGRAGFGDQKVPPSKGSWSPLEVPFPNPIVLVLLPANSSPRRVLSLSSGEPVLESFNRLGHHWGNFCEKRNQAVASDRGSLDTHVTG